MSLTPKQASRALAALDGMFYREQLYRELAHVENKPYIWEQEAIARLRWHLLSMLPDGDPQLVPERETE